MANSAVVAPDSVGVRLYGVDVLRGLCVTLVVLHHIHLRFVLNHYKVSLLPPLAEKLLFWSAYYAVIIFFTISGFLITRHSVLRWGSLDHIHVGSFYRMRIARILPCLLLLVGILTALHLAGVTDFTIKPERSSLGRALVAAFGFHVNWLEGHHGYLPGGWDVLWSLSVEETFYLLFPLLCLLFRSERLLLLPLTALIIAGPISRVALADQDPWGSYAYLSCMDGIAFGCIAALISVRCHLSVRIRQIGLILGAVSALLVLVVYDENSHAGLSAVGLDVTLLEIGVGLMLIAFGTGIGNDSAAVGTGWLRRIGRSSYEIYLFHMLVVLSSMALFRQMPGAMHWVAVWYGGAFLLSIVLGRMVASVYSEPLNRLMRSGHSRKVVLDQPARAG